MGLIANDLLKINSINDFIGDFTEDSWVNEAVKRAPFVVVRRALLIDNMVPVGVRGANRSERLATAIPYSSIIEIIKPEQLVDGKLWRYNKHIKETQIFEVLEAVDNMFKSYNLTWGPTGSVGFELASGVETVTATSDLDVIVRAPSLLPIETAKDITKELLKVPVKVDIQLEIPKGSVALAEYARGESNVLIRTINGPRLVKNLWSEEEYLEG